MKRVVIVTALIGIFLCNIVGQETNVKLIKAKDEKKVRIDIKKGENVTVIIDGKEYDSEIIDIVDPDKIESISVLKGESARTTYDKDRVLIITTKKQEKELEIRVVSDSLRIKVDGSGAIGGNGKGPVIVIDGTVAESGSLDKISPDDIHSVAIAKDAETMKEYNTTVGVIFIKTKKKE